MKAVLAKEQGRTIGEIVSALLALLVRKSPAGKQRLVWRTQSMRARVDLEDKDALN